MTYAVSTIDYATLPAALLPAAKAQVRVDFSDDDALLTDLIARAIDLYERKTGLSVFNASAVWEPDASDTETAYGVLCPVQPVSSFTVEDADGADITADFTLAGNLIPGRASGLYLQFVGDVNPALPVNVSMTIGYSDAASIVPATKDSLMRLVGHLYQNREAVSDLLLREADWWADDLLAGAWVPRA